MAVPPINWRERNQYCSQKYFGCTNLPECRTVQKPTPSALEFSNLYSYQCPGVSRSTPLKSPPTLSSSVKDLTGLNWRSFVVASSRPRWPPRLNFVLASVSALHQASVMMYVDCLLSSTSRGRSHPSRKIFQDKATVPSHLPASSGMGTAQMAYQRSLSQTSGLSKVRLKFYAPRLAEVGKAWAYPRLSEDKRAYYRRLPCHYLRPKRRKGGSGK